MTDGQIRFSGRMDAALTASVDDWAPADIAFSGSIYITADGDYNITGILAEAYTGGGTAQERGLFLHNTDASNTVSLIGSDAGSDAVNQFGWVGTVVLAPGEGLLLKYDRSALLWRLIGRSLSAGGAGTPGGSDTQVQFNDASAFGGDAGLVYNKTADLLTASNVKVGSITSWSGDAAITVSTAAEHDWNPAGTWATSGSVMRVNPDTQDTSITGIIAPSSPNNDGRLLALYNIGTGGFVLNIVDASGSSSVGNRFGVGGTFAIPNGQGALFIYDLAGTVWRCIGRMWPAAHTHASSTTGGQLGTGALQNDAVTYAKIQDVSATDKVLGRSTSGAGDVEEIAFTAAARTVADDATVSDMVNTLGGASATGTGGLVRATSPTLVTPLLGTPTSGVLTNCTGLPTAGHVDDSVTYAKIQNVSATDKLLGRSTAGAGDVEEIACTAAGRAILDDADAAAQRVTLGVDPKSTFVFLGSDVTNNDATQNTLADVTGLSFAVTAGVKYWFNFVISYTAAASTTGSRWTVNGPAVTSLLYSTRFVNGPAGTIQNTQTAYDLPSQSSAASTTTDANIAEVEGVITPSSSGTLILRFASEISGSAITAKAGSWLEWRVIG